MHAALSLNLICSVSVWQSLQDSAIAEFIAKSSNLRYFPNCRRFCTWTRLLTSSQCAFSQRKVVSRFKKLNEQLCVLFMPDLQELHWTNEPKAEQIRATRLGYRPFICSDRRRGLLSITRHRYTRRWEIQWSSRIHRGINNISVKSCEKHSNSPQNYVKATDIEINSTDVETRRNIVQ